MTFLNKIIDKAKHTAHNANQHLHSIGSSSHHQQQQQIFNNDFLQQQQQQQQQQQPQQQSITPKSSNEKLNSHSLHNMNVGGGQPIPTPTNSQDLQGLKQSGSSYDTSLSKSAISPMSNNNDNNNNNTDATTHDINMKDNNNTAAATTAAATTAATTTATTTTTNDSNNNINNNNNTNIVNAANHSTENKSGYQHYDQQVMQQRKNRPKLKLEDFYLSRTLGTGSFGRVHLVQSKHNHRFYAMKVLKKSEVVRLKQVEHTNNEKMILEVIACPFIVNLWGTFQDSSFLYMVLDYVSGGEMFNLLRRSKRFPDHVAKFYGAEVTLALEYLHNKHIVYRDLKPENILLDTHGHIKLTDFGFAKHVPDVTWTLCGTPDYLAPEIIQSKGYGIAVDWWSLGILIFEMLAGHPPFYDEDHLKLYEKIIQGKIKWPPYFEPSAKHLLERLLTADLSKRYGNLKGGADDIKNHAWFDGVNFDIVAKRQIRAPFIPKLNGEGDTSNFDKYPETKDQYGLPSADPYADKFPDF